MRESEMMKKKNHVNISLIFLTLIIASVIAYTFMTDYFPKHSKEFLVHKKAYKQIIDKRDLAIKEAIKGSELETIINEINTKSKKELAEYDKTYYKLKYKHYFFGYTSLRNFILGTGISLLSFTISVLFLFVIIKHIKDKNLKNYYLSLSFVLFVVTGFWLSWSLLRFSIDENRPFDFPKSWYNFCIYVLPSLIFITLYYLFKHHKTLEKKLRGMVHTFSRLAIKDAPTFMKSEEKELWTEHYLNEMEKGIDH